jgi:hypothetical protein
MSKKSYKEGKFYKEYLRKMKEAIYLAKQGASKQEVKDFFDTNIQDDIGFIILESKGLIPLYQTTAQTALDKLLKRVKPIEPFKEEEEEYQDDVEDEPPGYKLVETHDDYDVYEDIAPKKPIKLTPPVFKNIRPLNFIPSVFQPPPMPTKEEIYEAQRENNALARIRVFEGHKKIDSVF